MSDAKRTPYREKAPVVTRPPTEPRGPVVRRAEPGPADEPVVWRKRGEEPVDPDAGVFSGLVSPHAASTTGEWVAQIALTLIGLPLIVSTFVLVGWFDTRRAYGERLKLGHATPRPVGIAHPVAWILGAAPIALACFAGETHWLFATATIGVPFGALSVRRWLRRQIVEREALLERRRKRA